MEALPRRRELSAAEYEALDYLKRPPSDPKAQERHWKLHSCYEYWVARYEAGVRAFDHHFSSLRDELVERELWDSTYIVVTSDHGEALLDHGLWDHGFSVGHVEVWVPLLLRWPGRLSAGERVLELVRHIDLMPTLLDQLELPAVEGVQGRSFAWRLRGEEAKLSSNASAAAPRALSEAVKRGPEQKVFYAGSRKLMRIEDESGGVRDQVYDVSQRDGEDRPVVGEGAELERRRLRESLERQLLENAQRSVEVEQRVLDDQERQRLEALGYLPGS